MRLCRHFVSSRRHFKSSACISSPSLHVSTHFWTALHVASVPLTPALHINICTSRRHSIWILCALHAVSMLTWRHTISDVILAGLSDCSVHYQYEMLACDSSHQAHFAGTSSHQYNSAPAPQVSIPFLPALAHLRRHSISNVSLAGTSHCQRALYSATHRYELLGACKDEKTIRTRS